MNSMSGRTLADSAIRVGSEYSIFNRVVTDELPSTLSEDAEERIRKIPPEQRRRPNAWKQQPTPLKRLIARLRMDTQFIRFNVQLAFILLCVWIGFEFHAFVQWGSTDGAVPFTERPPGVEGFLPISALMSLSYWIQTGVINEIHPSGLFILIAIVTVGLLAKKAFCSWLCPIGTISESLWSLGKKIFGRTLNVPRWLDYPLRSLKYLLLFYFIYAIASMDAPSLKYFIYSPYNKVADIKMYLFFAEITEFALWTILILAALSIVIKNFWCRYLCPYGALLGALSWLSPLKITRTTASCIDCALCTKACPSQINVHTHKRVWSDECFGCLQCVDACPVKDTLSMKASRNSKAVPGWVFAVIVALLFTGITGAAMLAGKWQNGITREEYQRRFKELNAPVYQHFRGEVAPYGPND